jgi:histone deacetylase 6
MGDADYLYAFQKIVMPIAYEFSPELVIGDLDTIEIHGED